MAHLAKQLLQPIVVVWLVLIVLFFWQLNRRLYKPALISGFLVFGLYLAGATPFSGWLLAGLEKPYLNKVQLAQQKVDAVVVLGGYISDGQSHEPVGFDVNRHFDRLLMGVKIVRSGKCNQLVVGGGSIRQGTMQIPEYELVKQWLEEESLESVAFLDLGVCANTRDEAKRVFALKEANRWQSVVLVTSAWHMKRAEAVFQTAGVKVIPVTCDFSGFYPGPDSSILNHYLLLPQAGRLDSLRVYLQERIGWLYYRSRGWINPGV